MHPNKGVVQLIHFTTALQHHHLTIDATFTPSSLYHPCKQTGPKDFGQVSSLPHLAMSGAPVQLNKSSSQSLNLFLKMAVEEEEGSRK